MGSNRIKNVVIVGGGTAGWMAAAMLSKMLGKQLTLTLIESDAIGTVGVGEATIPPILAFNKFLGLDENEFMRQTKSTIKMGIEFQNWGNLGDRYMHAFGYIGRKLGMTPFHHVWVKCLKEGNAQNLEEYSFNNMAARAGKFARMEKIENTPLEGLAYAYHFDAGLYAQYLRKYCQQGGVKRIEGKINKTNRRSEDGYIDSVSLESGKTIEGDLFIDCSGFRGLLIEGALQTGYEDWTHWLPCDRAIAVPCSNEDSAFRPYTQSIAHAAGWQWRIPLQHRTGNGHVFCSDHMSEDEATQILLSNLDGEALKDPITIKFKTGMRKQLWNKNCITLGLASGFIEPLESTSIHLIQSGITNLVKHFPALDFNEVNRSEYNRRMTFEYEAIRDFIILHYHLNSRDDSPFWIKCREMDVPETLKRRMEIFKQTGQLYRQNDELFTEVAWLQIMVGQGLIPDDYSPLADNVSSQDIAEYLKNLNSIMSNAVKRLPSHQEFIAQNCAANS